MPAPTRYLDPAVLARLGTLDLKAKTIVEGVLSGLHRSPFRGFSVEFAEYRQYMPGDALSTIDWKVFARTDRHYVKKFEEDTNLDCHLLLDVSGSMGYGSGAVTKREYGCYLAASLAYLMHRQRDAVGLIAFDDRIVHRVPPGARAGHLKAVLLALERLPVGQRTDVAKPLGDLAKVLSKRGLVVVISDLLDEPTRVIDGLRHFRQRGTDVIVFHVLDREELRFTFDDAARFRDVETAAEVFADPAAVRGRYLERVEQFIATYRRELGGAGIDYHLLDTSQPLDLALMAYLSARGAGLMGLSFLAPAFLAGVIAIAIPIVLHLFRRRTDRVVDFPAMQMLPEAPVESHERRRLRDLLLLALRAAALVLLALSFARPYFASGSAPVAAPTTIVAVDRSLSLGAPGQWAEAVRLASEALDAAPATHLVGVVAFDDRADLVVAPTVDRAAARAAVAALTPGAGGTRYPAALARATEALERGGGRIVMVTDLQAGGWDASDSAPTPESVEIVLQAVAPPAGNLAVTSARIEGGALTAVVQSYAPGPRVSTVRARVGGRTLATARVELGPQASTDVRLDAAWPSDGAAEISVDDVEGYPADNTWYLALDRAAPAAVLVLTADPPESARTGLYVQRALEAAGPGAGTEVAVVDGRRLDLAAARPDALIVVGTRTLTRSSRATVAAYLAAGGRVWLSLGPDVDVPTLGEVLGVPLRLAPEPVEASGDEAALVPADRRHPMLRRLTGSASALSRLPIERYRRVLDDAGWDVLARFAGGSIALAERRVGEGVLVLFTSDLDNRWNRFPLEPSFAPFVIETARYLTGGLQSRSAFTVPDVPDGVPAVPGPHSATTATGTRTVVVNVQHAESDPAPMAAAAFLARVPRTGGAPASRDGDEARVQESAQRLWQLGLLVMLGLLAVESLVGRGRRPAQAAHSKVG